MLGGCGHSCPLEGQEAVPTRRRPQVESTSPRSTQLLHQLRRNFFQKPRRHTRLRHIRPIPPPIHGTRQNQSIHGSRHADIAQPPFFFDRIRLEHGPRMRKQPLLHSGQHHQRKLQPLGRMQRHQRDLRVLIVLVGVADQCGMIEKLSSVSPRSRESMAAFTSSRRFSIREKASGVSSSSSCLMYPVRSIRNLRISAVVSRRAWNAKTFGRLVARPPQPVHRWSDGCPRP